MLSIDPPSDLPPPLYKQSPCLCPHPIQPPSQHFRDTGTRKASPKNVLSERSLRSFEPTMSSEIDVFLKLFLDTNNAVVNMSPLCERLTTDVAGQLAFRQPLDTQTEERNRAFPRAMISMNGLVSISSE
ncbi:hypothetical protein BOTNAR_1690g00010 [Botryotinia narcissicola]|uniref:Uncharacterized protein n=1 Tax=Botryotinia narcissicola TaxID=278944 RepID=A0A4Z1H4B6_9HELO|nr:hypothetical protein BOTNAR_1690g00010 [Botryotinia narcissicola]